MAIILIASTCVAFAGTNTSLPFSDTFEAYTNLTPLNTGTNGWYGSSSDIKVQTNTVRTGTNAAMIAVDCTLSNRFQTIPATNIWIQMDVRPSLYDGTNSPDVDTNQTAMFYINTNGNFVVHNGPARNDTGVSTPTNSTNWVIVTTAAAVPANTPTWVRINIYENFAQTNWNLYANGVLVTNDIGFITNLPNFAGFDIYNGNDTSYLDNVSVETIATNETTQLPLIVTPPVPAVRNYYVSETPSVQTVKIYNVWSETIGFELATDQSWLTASSAGGDLAPGTATDVTLTYANTLGWRPGASNAFITVMATDGSAHWDTQTVAVVLNLTGHASGTTNTIPFYDDFEDYGNLTPLVRGINGWYGSTTNIIVQQNEKCAGLQAAMIPVDCTLSNPFVPASPTNVWIQIDVRASLFNGVTNPAVDTNAAMMFYINSNGNFVVHNGPADPSTTNSTNWVAANSVTIDTNAQTWVHISIYENFAETNWNLYANGIQVTNNIGFINTNLTNFAGFDIYNGDTTSYVDNVSVTTIATNETTQLPLIVIPTGLLQSNLYAGATKDVYPLVQTVKVVNVWSTDIGFELRTNQSWVSASLTNGVVTNGTTQTVVLTYANIRGWAAGTSNANVAVVATNGADFWGTQTVHVALTLINLSDALDVTPTQFSNLVWKGETPTNRAFEVRNLNELSFTYTVVTNQGWIASSSNAGTLSAYGTNILTLTNTVSTATWEAWTTSNATVTVTATNNAFGVAATKTVAVAINVQEIAFVVTPTNLTNTAWIGDTPPSQSFTVANTGDFSFVYSASVMTGNWVSASADWTVPGKCTNTVTLTYTPTWGFVGPKSNTTIRVVSSNGYGATQDVAVVLNIYPTIMDYYVATNGGDVFPYTNWTDAASTLTAAVYTANSHTNVGSVVWISNGLYDLPAQITLSNITVRSVNGATNVMLNGGAFRGFKLAHTGATLSGLTITNCQAGNGTNGGAVFVATGMVWNCRLLGNTAVTNGGGASVGPGGILRDCLIWGNRATNGGGVYFDMAGRVGNAVGGLVENCTVASNYADVYGGGFYTDINMTGLCVNVVVYTNSVAGSGVYSNWGTNVNARLVFTNSCVGLPVGEFGANSLTNSNPLFVDNTIGDCRLRSASPCINAGINQPWMENALDLEGNIRKRFGRVDMGAYEWYPYQGMGIKVNGVRYEKIKFINGAEPLWINGITNSSSVR